MESVRELLKNINLVDITGGELKRIGNSYYIYPCPICGKNDNHFAIKEDKEGVQIFKCFCNGLGGSAIDFISYKEGLDTKEAVKRLCEANRGHEMDFKKKDRDIKLNTEQKESTDYKKALQDLKIFQEEIKNQESFDKVVAYMSSRGFTEAESRTFIDKYKLGYNRAFNSLAIALKQGYIYRSFNINKKGVQGNNSIINQEALQHNFIFICEGFFDMLSLEALNLKAISLNSVKQVPNFIELLSSKENFQEKKYIIAFDNDKAGSSATENLKSYFENNNISYSVLELPKAEGEEKQDVNNLFCTNKDLLQKNIQEVKNNFFSSYLNNEKKLLELTEANKGKSSIKTNYDKLDNILNGGLQEAELTVLGAESSVGKTTFMLNLMDNIAIEKPVLYFSIEQSEHELYCKLLSKEYYITNKKIGKFTKNIATNNSKGSMRDFQNLSNITIAEFKEMQHLRASRDKNIYMIEGNFILDVNVINKQIEDFICLFDKVPLVVIDYLQIIKAPADLRLSDKQVLDYNITSLRQISRSTKAHIICISSFNRNSYGKKAELQGFKESGTIEYTADNVFALTPLEILEGKEEGTEIYKSKSIKTVAFQTLKYRAGLIKREPLLFEFTGNYSYFMEKDFYTKNKVVEKKETSKKIKDMLKG